EEDLLHLVGLRVLARDDALELAVLEVVDLRRRLGMTKEALRREDDERLPPGAEHLTAERVEEPRRRRQVADLDVVLGRQLQEAFDARARVLRPLPFVAVRQKKDEPREAEPLVLGRDDELIDDDLRRVEEVAELRLPHDEAARAVEAVAILEAEDA